MIAIIKHQVRFDSTRIEQGAASWHEYIWYLVAIGVIARQEFCPFQLSSDQFSFHGRLCVPNFPLLVPMTFTGSRAEQAIERISEIHRLRQSMESNALSSSETILADLRTSDDSYCIHDVCPSLVVQSPGNMEISSLVCGQCQGYVSPAVLPISDSLFGKISEYDVLRSSIDGIYRQSGVYEEWSELQLHNADSELNQLGITIATQLRHQLGIDVHLLLDYSPYESETGEVPNACPRCKSAMELRPGIPARFMCTHCPVLLG